ncbi:MAG: beta-lactamase family protein [Chloroflexi bacterium]|nr:beta-lactamase family protein [Chloroflexota bacterium]
MNTFKRIRTLFVLLYLTLVLALTIEIVNASPTLQGKMDFAAIDAFIETQRKDLSIPGMALGIVQGDQIVHLQSFGVADSSGRKVTPQTPFYIGSLTKSFTALAVMQLVEAGKIELDTPVQKYLPWFELADKAASAKITVRHLLNQTTGISIIDGNRFWNSQLGLEETVREFKTIQLTQPVGTTYQYSNINYSIAGLIVEKVSGQSYADYVTQHIFEPLDMRHSYASRALAKADGLADGHYYMFGRVLEFEVTVGPAQLPFGFLMASVEDMSQYAIAQLNDGRYGKSSILSPPGIAELHAPAIPMRGDQHYALGWNISPLDGKPIVWHNGDTGRNHSIIMLMPERGLGFVLLANASGFEQLDQVDNVAIGVLNMLNGKSPSPVSLPFPSRFLYWTILLTPLLMIMGIAYSWRHWRNKGVGHILLTVVLYGGVALFWLFGIPQVITSPILPGIWFFYPELACGLIAGATLGIGWSVIYTVMNLRARRSK